MTLEHRHKTRGFTLVELIVSMALFTVVVFITTSAFLTVSNLHKKARVTRAVMDSLSTSLESMVRNIRTGYNYNCSNTPAPGAFFPVNPVLPLDCSTGGTSLLFTTSDSSGNNSNYWFNANRIEYKTGDQEGYVTAEEIYVTNAKFYVTGTVAMPADTNQPRVNMVIQGYVAYDPEQTPFSIYTSVTQRALK